MNDQKISDMDSIIADIPVIPNLPADVVALSPAPVAINPVAINPVAINPAAINPAPVALNPAAPIPALNPAAINPVQLKKDKKRPGRPPKKKPELVIAEVMGIAREPADPEHRVEMVYCNPAIYKKLLSLYKGYNATEIEFIFEPEFVKIVIKDHLCKSNVYTLINGKLLNFYYCRERVRICVKREFLEHILGNLDKQQYKVTFISRNDSYRSSLNIIVKDYEYDKETSYDVEVIYKPDDQAADMKEDDTKYPLKFTFTGKHFKTEINKIAKISKLLTIQKAGLDPMQFAFNNDKQIKASGPYTNPEKIRLISTIAPDDILSVSVPISCIQPFSSACGTDDVHIAVDKKEKISFTTFLDKKGDGHVITVKAFTEIKAF